MNAPPTPACVIADCTRPARKRGWCERHYYRWRINGDPLVVRRASNGTYSTASTACSVDDCEQPAKTCGYCNKHYQRFQKHGDPLVVLQGGQPRKPAPACSIEGCERPAIARSWCERHYRRWQKHGDPETLTGPRTGESNWLWKGETASYKAKHHRVQRIRGKADCCVWDCQDDFRYEWANLTGNYDDPDDYAPMCVLCHRRYDASRIKTERQFNMEATLEFITGKIQKGVTALP